MLKGALIFAAGAAAGLAVGTINGLIIGFRVADSINKVSIGPFPPEGNSATEIKIGSEEQS